MSRPISLCRYVQPRARAYRAVGIGLVLSTGLLAMGGGCASGRPEGPPPKQHLNIEVPVITTQRETQIRQPKGGLEISIAPATYTVVPKTTLTSAQSHRQHMFEYSAEPRIYVDRTTETTANATPERLEFLVTLNNQMPRVFHGAGTVVQFNVGGQVLPVEQRGYAGLQGAIIPPRTEQQVRIYGPAIDTLPKSGIIGVFLYDVVTNQNEAGVVTEKQNYQWYFDYTMTPQPVDVDAPHTETVGMSYQAYQAEMMKTQREQMLQQYRAAGVPVPPQGAYAPPAQ